MCGCMIMHATMDHSGHQPAPQAGSSPNVHAPVTAVPTSDYKCAHCGFPLQKDFAFCPSCGMNLRLVTCPACGQKVDPSWSTCAYCGAPLGETLESVPHNH